MLHTKEKVLVSYQAHPVHNTLFVVCQDACQDDLDNVYGTSDKATHEVKCKCAMYNVNTNNKHLGNR